MQPIQTTNAIPMAAALLFLAVAAATPPQLPRVATRRPTPGMVHVPAGTFEMGDHQGGGQSDEAPVHPVVLDAFDIDAHEVSNEEYAGYLNTALNQSPPRVTVDAAGVVYQVGGAGYALCDTTWSYSYSSITWDGSTFGVTVGREDHPMLAVSWYGACAYANQRSHDAGLSTCYDESTWDCDYAADGYRLPTEAEWEYAARGGEHGPYYEYPWGVTIDGSQANYWDSGDPFERGAVPWTAPVGYYDGNQTPPGVDMANGYGLYDTSGNVWEWCGDWYSSTYYSGSPSDNPSGPSSGSERVIRGASWHNTPLYLRSANRSRNVPTTRNIFIGFRVVAARP